MNTPICDFVNRYRESLPLRLHMPGHKGTGFFGFESGDITEILGADELYHPRGVILESERNAASLFGAARTVYSTEGSSLCVRAMLYLALLDAKARRRRPLILAGRNAHRSLRSAAALLDLHVRWLYGESAVSCVLDGETASRALDSMKEKPAAVYVTSPDYLGHLSDIRSIADACRRRDVPLLVDNAHGAYLKFLPQDQHPMTLGADICCDSAHKTLPALTGAAYLHIGENAPALFAREADRAMALFASTSPSYLILQSLDRCNAYLDKTYREDLAAMEQRLRKTKELLLGAGFSLIGNESGKLTVAPKSFGYTGDQLHDLLRASGIECEFSDPDFLTAMPAPALKEDDFARLENALLSLPRRAAIFDGPPPLPRPRRALTFREAALAPSEEIPAALSLGRVLADGPVSCPPCVPVAVSGEVIDEDALRCFRYYGIETCRVVREEKR